MAIKTREEIMNTINERFGGETDDATLGFIEDIADTFSDLESRANGDGTDWKKKYEENDSAWRQKYRDRFFGKSDPEEKPLVPDPPKPEEDERPHTFEELFKYE